MNENEKTLEATKCFHIFFLSPFREIKFAVDAMDENNDHEVEEVVDDFEEERRRMALRRRSSMANSIRRSQSIVGISFEDQVRVNIHSSTFINCLLIDIR